MATDDTPTALPRADLHGHAKQPDRSTTMDSIETHERNGFTVHIDPDYDVDRPHDSDSLTRLALFHSRYNFPNDAGISPGDWAGWAGVAAEIRASQHAVYLMPVYMLDHSGLVFQVSESYEGNPFLNPWDSAQVGCAWITAGAWKERQGSDWTGSDDQLAVARGLIRTEVEYYGRWVNGETYAYRIVDRYGEQVGECGGYIGMDDVTEEANAAADAAQHTIKCNGHLDRTLGQIVHDGPCDLHPGPVQPVTDLVDPVAEAYEDDADAEVIAMLRRQQT